MTSVWLMVALAGNKFEGVPTDVEVSRAFAADAATLHAAVADLRAYAELLPADCAKDWQFTSTTAGRGARTLVTYTYGPLKRKLTAVVVEDQPGRLFRIDHENEKKGFFVQTTYPQGADGRTTVVLSTPLNPPPWPLRPPFYNKVLPAWRGCYERALENLATRVGG